LIGRKGLAVCSIATILLACGKGEERGVDEALFAEGKMVYHRMCFSCHDPRTRLNGTGPYLVGIEGRRAGSVKGFNYSSAMRDFALEWGADTLDAFLADPRTTIPGTKMAIEPIPDPNERAAVIYFITHQ
jgi:cytochrome c